MTVDISFGDFVRTRHALWLDKSYGVPADNFVTAKHIDMLRDHHLTNVWREVDRGTLAVINDLQYTSQTTYQAVWRTLLYRFFNSWSGYNRYMETVVNLSHPTEGEIAAIINQPGNFSGAYIRTIKFDTVVKALQSLHEYADRVASLLHVHGKLDSGTAILYNLVEIRRILGQIPSFGAFLADQLMLDFSWIGNPWYMTGFEPGLGPGAKRGLDRVGLSFKQAMYEGQEALADIPVPRVLVSLGDKSYSAIEVTFGVAECEHQLCEAEKIWKLQEAKEEGLGRKVKMRGYSSENPRAKNAKPPLVKPLPYSWVGPHFKKVF